MQNKAVFVDRDGTLVEEVNFLSRLEDLRLFPFTADAVTLLKRNGYLIVVVSNQSGVGRGLFEESSVLTIHEGIQRELGHELDGLYYCPHLPGQGCSCRKPSTGMIEKAAAELNIDLEGSWMVGDKWLDVETGMNAGLYTALVKTGYGEEHSRLLRKEPDIIAENFLVAAKGIVSRNKRDG